MLDRNDPLTDAEQELIQKILQESNTDDAKELEACKAKLTWAEQQIAMLRAQLKQYQLQEETSQRMFAHKQRMDARHKSSLESPKKIEIIIDPVKSPVALKNPGRPERNAKLFAPRYVKKRNRDDDDDFMTCFEVDTCRIT